MAMSPAEALVQRQLEAYNARDLAAFVAVYGDDIALFRPPATEAFVVGKAALAEMYATQRFNLPGLHAELLGRIVLGNKVIDHERISGVREQAFDVAAVYEVGDGLIRKAWFFNAD
jgi:hypothetical protein